MTRRSGFLEKSTQTAEVKKRSRAAKGLSCEGNRLVLWEFRRTHLFLCSLLLDTVRNQGPRQGRLSKTSLTLRRLYELKSISFISWKKQNRPDGHSAVRLKM